MISCHPFESKIDPSIVKLGKVHYLKRGNNAILLILQKKLSPPNLCNGLFHTFKLDERIIQKRAKNKFSDPSVLAVSPFIVTLTAPSVR